MAKIRTLDKENKKPIGRIDKNQVHLNVRVPIDWMAYLTAILEEKRDQHGTYRMTDLVREALYLMFIKPSKDSGNLEA